VSDPSNHAAVYIERVTLHNFRGIAECTLTLEPSLTLLVGRNNVGKSRLLRAIAVALGGLPADRDDLTVGGPETTAIDVVLAPLRSPNADERFDARVQRRIGRDVQLISEAPERERLGWRTTIGPSREGTGVRAESKALIFDSTVGQWRPTDRSLDVDRAAMVACSLVDTGRDLTEELGRRGSAIRRILDDLEIPPADRAVIEAAMTTLSAQIISSSASLTAVTEALESLTNAVSSIGSARFSALPGRLEELSQSISIDFDTGIGHLPVRLHGSGSRSLASLQVRNVMYDRRLGRDRSELQPQPVTLIEEPEAHLHPQAQLELSELLESLTGQAVVSTHSAHLVTVVDPESIRLVRQTPESLRIVDFHPTESAGAVRTRRPELHVEEMEKLKRTVERPFGELLFSSVIVVGDGATERALLSPLIRFALGSSAHGVTVVDPASMGNASPVIKFANFVNVPWLLFSDSDPAGVDAARGLDSAYARSDDATITWVGQPGGPIKAVEALFVAFDADLCRAAYEALGLNAPAPMDEPGLVSAMTNRKGSLGRLLAVELVARRGDRERAINEPGYWPHPLQELLCKLRMLLGGGADGYGAQP
jgi:putative ATP-dependent endonuclease of the OLD family